MRSARVMVAAALAAVLAAVPAHAGGVLQSARVLAPDHVRVELGAPIADTGPANFRFTETRAPDVPIEILATEVQPGPRGAAGRRVLLTVGRRLDPAGSYRLELLAPAAA